ANPMAMILAAASLLSQVSDAAGRAAGKAIRESTLAAVAAGVKTADLGGHATTTEFTDEVIRRGRARRPQPARHTPREGRERTSRKIDAARSGAARMSFVRRSRWKSTSVNAAKITSPRTA